jgi:hypothetical protein
MSSINTNNNKTMDERQWTLYSLTTLAQPSLTQMATLPAQSTDTLLEYSKVAGTPDINTLVGEEKTPALLKQPTTQPTLRTKWKSDSDPLPEYSLPSTTNSVSDSLLSGEKEAAVRHAEMEGYLALQEEPATKKQRRSTQKKKKLPTENHLKLRSLIDAYGDWEEKLKDKLQKSEIRLCVGIVMKYAREDTFPNDDPDENPEHMLLTRPGWDLFRAYKKFADEHPECSNQTKHSGEWEMQ